jgi:hypothetical protein
MLIAMSYARDLWIAGQSLNIADPKKDLRVSSAAMTLYAYEIIIIDGKMCEDQSAPTHRIDQLLLNQRPTLAFIRSQAPSVKTDVVNVALALERKTAPLRQRDDLICRDGLAQMKASLKAGLQHDMPPKPGQFGRQVAVDAPPGWTPDFVSASVYKLAQDRAREDMKGNLLTLIGLR